MSTKCSVITKCFAILVISQAFNLKASVPEIYSDLISHILERVHRLAQTAWDINKCRVLHFADLWLVPIFCNGARRLTVSWQGAASLSFLSVAVVMVSLLLFRNVRLRKWLLECLQLATEASRTAQSRLPVNAELSHRSCNRTTSDVSDKTLKLLTESATPFLLWSGRGVKSTSEHQRKN